MSDNDSIAVIGAGIGGLAVGLRLAKKGYQVTIFEQSDRAGGKISEIRKNKFRFDTGPSLFTLPELVDELLEDEPANKKDPFKYAPLDIICRYFYPDGTKIDAYQNLQKFAEEVERTSQDSRESVLKYLKKSAEIYRLTKDIFIFNDLKNIRNYLNWKTFYSLMNAWKLESFRTLHRSNEASFKDPRVIQLFDRYATYNGSNPYQAPATLKVIPHLEHNVGAFFPTKGMYSIVEKLETSCRQLGVDFRFSEGVQELTRSGNRITGLKTRKGTYHFNRIISDVDVFSFNRLLDSSKKLKPSGFDMSTSAIIFYWGVKMQSEKLLLHNILFSENYQEEFECLFQKKQIFEDPTVYIFISSKVVTGDAPKGHENWFVMINAPENTGQDWQLLTKSARKLIINKIRNFFGIDIESSLVFEEVANPETIEQNTGSYHGSLYGLSSNNMWSAFRRHPNYLRSLKGLYFVGGSVHPGGGIPLCLASAKIVDDLFTKPK